MTRRLFLIRWSFYAGATLLILLLQSQLLGRITIWGVCPVIIPCIAAVAATQEQPRQAAIFAIVLGAVCDTLFAAVLPCFYVILCVVAAALSTLTARHLVVPGFRCSLVCCAGALIIGGAISAAVMLYGGAPFGAVVGLLLRETIVSLPFALVLIHFAFTYIHRITTP